MDCVVVVDVVVRVGWSCVAVVAGEPEEPVVGVVGVKPLTTMSAPALVLSVLRANLRARSCLAARAATCDGETEVMTSIELMLSACASSEDREDVARKAWERAHESPLAPGARYSEGFVGSISSSRLA